MTPRLKYLRQRLAELKLDVILVSQAANRRYLSGFTGSAGYLLISKRKSILATDFRYIEQSKAEAPDFPVVQITGELKRWFPKLISDWGVKRIGFESNDLTLSSYRQLVQGARKLPPKARPLLIPTQGLIESLRAIKDIGEMKSLNSAAALADAAIEHANNVLEPGVTERELAWILERFLREKGSENLPFEIIVASGPNSALPHARPTDRQILSGEPIVIDLGARIDGYCSDITRTICLGEPSERLKNIYRTVNEAQITAIKKLRTGMTGEEADSPARGVITESGYANAFGHSLGHGVGLAEHEQPRIGPNSADILIEGMVFTIEPGIYLEGWGGVRIEDMVSLEKSGPRVLTQSKKINI